MPLPTRLDLGTGVYLNQNFVRIPIPARSAAPFSVSFSSPTRNLHIIIQKIFKFTRETNNLQQKKPHNYNANLFCCYSHLIIVITISSSAIYIIFFSQQFHIGMDKIYPKRKNEYIYFEFIDERNVKRGRMKRCRRRKKKLQIRYFLNT